MKLATSVLSSLALTLLIQPTIVAGREGAANGLPLKENTADLWYDYGNWVEDVAAGHYIYVTGKDNAIFELQSPFNPNSGNWRGFPGGVERIANGVGDTVHVINKDGDRYQGDRHGNWVHKGKVANGYATDIGADAWNADGAVCWIGNHDDPTYGGKVYCDGVELANGLLGNSIDVMRNGMPIGINKAGTLYKATGSSYADPQWVPFHDAHAKSYVDCAAAPNYYVWGVTTTGEVDIYDHNMSFQHSVSLPGGAKAQRIAVDIYNVPWVVSDDYHLYKFRGLESLASIAGHNLWRSRRYKHYPKGANKDTQPSGEWWCVQIDKGWSHFAFIDFMYVNSGGHIEDDGAESSNLKCDSRYDIGKCSKVQGLVTDREVFKC